MRKLRRLASLAMFLALLGVIYQQFPSHRKPLATDSPDFDKSLPLGWPPVAEDGRRESFLGAISTYFRTLFAADEIVQNAQELADKTAQRQQELDKAIEENQ